MAAPPPPFSTVDLLPARRMLGAHVRLPDDLQDDYPIPPPLERHASVAGNVLCIETSPTPQYFWLQRKIRATSSSTHEGGSVRVGFCLTQPEQDGGMWDVVINEERQVQMVAVRTETKNPENMAELAAMQWVTQHATAHTQSSSHHVQGSEVLAASDSHHLFIVSPYEYAISLTLFDYCAAQPGNIVPEETARIFFRQILQGLETLQSCQLCHRNLSLESVLMRQENAAAQGQGEETTTICTLTRLASALRIPTSNNNTNDSTDATADSGAMTTTKTLMLQPQPIASSNPQYVAPELLITNDATTEEGGVPFDGYAVDLWASGVMLLAMLLGNDALFVAPVPEDRTFREMCVLGKLKERVQHYQQKQKSSAASISDDALDLLQNMLRIDPKDRLSLSGVQHHPWVVKRCE